MSQVEELVTYVFKWVTVVDARTCEKCLSLNGKEWRNQDLFQDAIWDEMYAGIWDLNANHSILHPNCRCLLEVTVEIHLEKIEVYNFTLGRTVSVGKTERFTILSADISALRSQMSGFFAEVKRALPEIREMNDLMTMNLALGRRLGSEDLTFLITLFQRGRITAEMFYRSAMMVYTSTGPIGWAIGLGGMFMGGFMLADMAEIRRPRY
jgi:hypothetical protein